MMAETTASVSEFAQRLLDGNPRALARAISLVEDDEPRGWELVRELYPRTGRASVVGFTGPPGAGKSTLIGALVGRLRAKHKRVGVLTIDPSSPFRGGAVLGDRIRMSEHFLDPGVFIRSMATRGAVGGLAEAALQAALLMDAAGCDYVLIETVGVGQVEVDIIDHADTVVLVLIPGSGDSIQALKAGIMEIPDVIVVNKADHPLTDTMVRQIRTVLSLAPRQDGRPAIVKTEAVTATGLDELVGALTRHREKLTRGDALGERRRRNLKNEVIALAAARLRALVERVVRDDPAVEKLLDEVMARRLDPASAARELLARGPVADLSQRLLGTTSDRATPERQVSGHGR
jgi:LAO/AO transport system kinase